MPRVQSRGFSAGLKFVRMVVLLLRRGSSERDMGGKRVSSNAL